MKYREEFSALLAPYKYRLTIAFLAILIANLSGLAFPWAMKVILDRVIAQRDLVYLNTVTLLLLGALCLKSYFGYLREYLASYVGEMTVLDLRNKIYWHLHNLSVHYLENNPLGKVISGIISDVDSIKSFLFGGLIDFIYAFFNIFFVIIILLALDWRLTLVCVVYLPVFVVAFMKLAPRLKKRHFLVREKYGELAAKTNEVLSGIRVVTGFSRNEAEKQDFDLKQKEILRASLSTHRLGIFLWMGAEFFSSLGLITLVWFGTRQVVEGRISIGTLMAFYSYLGMLFYPVIRLAVINNYYQEATASYEKIEAVLATEPKIKEVKHPIVLNNMSGFIEFKGVDFSYDGHKKALSRVTFKIKPHEAVALAGKSGAGKTTIVNLLLRFYDPTAGTILIDGHDLLGLSLRSYRAHVAMVMQDDYLFGASVKDNITYGRPGANDEDIIEAAQQANAHDFILKLPYGYDTQIGERGVKLSCGQRQRISIARAILRDPAILILDEATSAVDSETEQKIVEEAFGNLISGRTTLIIAHRLSSLKHADRIVFIDDGKVVEMGKHSELLEKQGRYSRMWVSQNAAH